MIRWMGMMCLLIVACEADRQRLVITLPTVEACAAVCVTALSAQVEADGAVVWSGAVACGSTLDLALPADAERVRVELTGTDAASARRAEAGGSAAVGDRLRLVLEPVEGAPRCQMPDAGIPDAGADMQDVADGGAADAADAGTPHALLNNDVAIFASRSRGDDAKAGTLEAPVASLARALALAEPAGKAVVLANDAQAYVPDGELRTSIHGGFDFNGETWVRQSPDIFGLGTRIETPESTALTVQTAADVHLSQVHIASGLGACTLIHLGPGLLHLRDVAVRGSPTADPSEGCAFEQLDGETEAWGSGFADFFDPTLRGRHAPTAVAIVRAGRLTTVNSLLTGSGLTTPALQVEEGASARLYSSAIYAPKGRCAVLRGSFMGAHVNCLAGLTAFGLPDANAIDVTLVNSIVMTMEPAGVSLRFGRPPEATVTLAGVLSAQPARGCFAAIDRDCVVQQVTDLNGRAEVWSAHAEALLAGDPLWELSEGGTLRPGSPAIDAGLGIEPFYDGPRAPEDFFGNPRPNGLPDLGWHEYTEE